MTSGEIHRRFPTLLDLLDHWASTTPSAPFLAERENDYLSYSACKTLAVGLVPRNLVGLCPSLGTTHGARVAIVSDNSPLYPICLWAFWIMGIVPVPLNIKSDPFLMLSMIQVAEVDLVLMQQSSIDGFVSAVGGRRRCPVPILSLEEVVRGSSCGSESWNSLEIIRFCMAWVRENEHEPAEMRWSIKERLPNDPAVVLFTSSGVDVATLKCVSYTHLTLMESSLRTIKAFGGSSYACSPKRHLGWLPLSHAFELTIGLLGVVVQTGGSYLFYNPSVSSPGMAVETPLLRLLLASLAYHHPVHSLFAVPTILISTYREMTPEEKQWLRSLDAVCAAGAASPIELVRWAQKENIRYMDLVGATEVAGGMCFSKTWDTTSGFQVMSGLMGVLELEQDSDDVGELIILSKSIPSSYDYGTSDAYSVSLDGTITYRTGDLYSIGSEFYGKTITKGSQMPGFDTRQPVMSGIFYLGRLDDIVVLSSGVKVDALGVERMLNSQPGIVRSALVTDSSGDALVALIELASEHGSPELAIESILYLNGSFPFEKRIHRRNILFVDKLPLTSKSTLHRKKVKQLLASCGGSWPANRMWRAPSSSLQELPSASISFTDVSEHHTSLRDRVEGLLSDVFGIAVKDVQAPQFRLSDLPMTSLASVRLANALRALCTTGLSRAQLYTADTVSDLCRLLMSDNKDKVAAASSVPESQERRNPVSPDDSDLVISGASCRFPGGVNTLDDFWSTLISPEAYVAHLGRQAPSSRWDSEVSDANLPMGWLDLRTLDDIHSFSTFFNIPPPEAAAMSPNARLVMQHGYNALEDAGMAPRSVSGRRWGIFTSLNDSGWREYRFSKLSLQEYSDKWSSASDDSAGGRLAHFLDLRGPCMDIKAACSSSAVAIHQACRSIEAGDCEAALVIAATTHLMPSAAVFRSRAGIGSRSGKCSTFSEDADGFLPSEACTAIFIQRRRDISVTPYARIRGTAVGQDGRSLGFTAPNAAAQADVLQKALNTSGCVPDDIYYYEAHGTGTPVGDAIEVDAINRVYGGKRTRPLLMGSVKAVVGHTEECAGLAGVLKTMLCLRYKTVPPQPNLGFIHPNLDTCASKIVIPRTAQALVDPDSSKPVVCVVSSFGLSGTLAHIILEGEGQGIDLQSASNGHEQVFILSSPSMQQLIFTMRQFISFSNSVGAHMASFDEVCRTSRSARDPLPYRRAWVARSWNELLKCVRTSLDGPLPMWSPPSTTVALWFSLPHRHAQLLPVIDNPMYHQTVAECYRHGCTLELDWFARQLAVARVLEIFGCRVSVVSGEGPGEYIAAVFAGILSLPDAFDLLAALETEALDHDVSSKVVDRCPHDTLQDYLLEFGPDEVWVRAEYGQRMFGITGRPEILQKLEERMQGVEFTDASLFLRARLAGDKTHRGKRGKAGAVALVSSQLGGLVDTELSESHHYWNSVATGRIDVPAVLECFSSRCDMVVDLSTSSLIDDSTQTIVAFNDGLQNVFGQLFESGINLKWEEIYAWSKSTKMAHLPTTFWNDG